MKANEIQSITIDVPIYQLKPGHYQPRRSFDETSLQSLANTIREQGIIQPIVIRPLKSFANLTATNNFHKYEIIAGERRWRAAQIVGLDTVPCLIKRYSDEQAAKIALIENMHRENLNPIEEARAVLNIINENVCTHEEAAVGLGISREQVTNLLRLLKLDERVQEMLITGELYQIHGRILAGLPVNLQYEFAIKCKNNKWSKRSLENAIKNINMAKMSPKKSIDVVNLERNLSEHLGTPVLFEKEYIKIKYDNLEIMEGILQKIGYKEPM